MWTDLNNLSAVATTAAALLLGDSNSNKKLRIRCTYGACLTVFDSSSYLKVNRTKGADTGNLLENWLIWIIWMFFSFVFWSFFEIVRFRLIGIRIYTLNYASAVFVEDEQAISGNDRKIYFKHFFK